MGCRCEVGLAHTGGETGVPDRRSDVGHSPGPSGERCHDAPEVRCIDRSLGVRFTEHKVVCALFRTLRSSSTLSGYRGEPCRRRFQARNHRPNCVRYDSVRPVSHLDDDVVVASRMGLSPVEPSPRRGRFTQMRSGGPPSSRWPGRFRATRRPRVGPGKG